MSGEDTGDASARRRSDDMALGGRQYHVDLAPGEVGDFLFVCGEPDRARRIASRFGAVELERTHREFVSFTGTYHGRRVTAMATGIGPDNTEIALAEVHALGASPVVVRIGSCGGIGPGVGAGHLVVSQASVRLENTSSSYAPAGFPAAADPGVTRALAASARKSGRPVHVGITATAPGFYAPQGRPALGRGFPRGPSLDHLARMGVVNFEMESSLLFTMASAAGWRAGCVCAVYADRTGGDALDPAAMESAEAACIEAGLGVIGSFETSFGKADPPAGSLAGGPTR